MLFRRRHENVRGCILEHPGNKHVSGDSQKRCGRSSCDSIVCCSLDKVPQVSFVTFTKNRYILWQ